MAKHIPEIDEAGELLERIEAAERDVDEAEKHVESCKEDLKEAKNTFALKMSVLRNLAGARSEGRPLLDGEEEDEE